MSESMPGNTGSTAGQSARMSYEHARDAAKTFATNVRDRAGEYYQQGRTKATEYEQKVEGFVREQPIKSVLIAAGAGLLLGMLLRRR